jgi:glycerate 2-kinase
VKQHVMQGVNGDVPETPKPDDEAFTNVHNIIIGSARIAAAEIKKDVMTKRNANVHVLTDKLEGEASNLGNDFATLISALHRHETRIDIDTTSGFFKDIVLDVQYNKARDTNRDSLLIFTGEPTVIIKGNGVGGRNQEMLLATSIALESREHGQLAMLGCGMDGIEGNSTAAGAIIDDHTFKNMEDHGLDPQQFLENNDSYACFSNLGDVIITGPTGTNVNDLGMIFVDVPITSIKIRKKS